METKTIPERMATIEEAHASCKELQEERSKEVMARIRRIEDRWNLLLGAIALTLLGVVFNIVLAFLKK